MNFKKLETTFAAAAQQSGLLGTLFWWDLGQNRIDHHVLVAHADKAGLDKALLPPAVKPANAFRRAWRAAARRIDSDLLLRQIADTPDVIVVAVVREKPDVAHLDLGYEVLARATFDKKVAGVTILEPHPVLDALPALCHHYTALTTGDIRAMVLTFVKRSGLSIRHAGGVYFIPPQLSPTMRALTEVLRVAGANTVWSLPVADLGDAGTTLASLAKETLDAEIAGVEAELAAFDARDIEVREGTLQRRLKKFEELRSRTSLMAGALSFRADTMLDKLTRLEGDVKQKLFGMPQPSGQEAIDPEVDPDLFDALQTDDEEHVGAAPEPVDADVGF